MTVAPAPDIIDDILSLERRVLELEVTLGEVQGTLATGSVSGGYDPTTQQTVPSHIVTGSVISSNLYSGTVDAYLIRGTHVAADAIEAKHIRGMRIVAGELEFETATGAFLTVGQIAAGAISANHLKTATLDAGGARIGGLTAGHLNTGSVTAGTIAASAFEGSMFSLKSGGLFYTGDTGSARMVFGTNIATSEGTKAGLLSLNSANQITGHWDPASGTIKLKGQILPGSTGLGSFDDQLAAKNIPPLVTQVSDPANPTAAPKTLLMVNGISVGELSAGSVAAGSIVSGSLTSAQIRAGGIIASSLLVMPGGTNMVPNSSFELEIAATPGNASRPYIAVGQTYTANTLTRVMGGSSASIPTAKHGSWVMEAAYGNDLRMWGIHLQERLTPLETVAMSAWIWIPPEWNGGQIQTGDESMHGADSVILARQHADMSLRGRWQRVWYTFRNGNADRTQINFFLRAATAPTGTVAANKRIFIDSVQIERGDMVTGYSPKADEILPGSVGTTEIGPGKIEVTNLADAFMLSGTKITPGSITVTQLGALQTGGGNRLVNSDFFFDNMYGRVNTGYAYNGNDVYKGPYECTSVGLYDVDGAPGRGRVLHMQGTGTSTATTNPHIFSPLARTSPGERITISYWARKIAGTDRAASSGARYFTASGIYTNYIASGQRMVFNLDGTKRSSATITSAWGRVVETLTVPAGGFFVDMYAQALAATNVDQFEVTAFQIEGGEMASAWSPASEEVIPASVGTTQIQGGSITTEKISFSVGGMNYLPDSSFENVNLNASPPAPWTQAGVGAYARSSWTYTVAGVSKTIRGVMPGGGKWLDVSYASGSDPFVYYRFAGDSLLPFLGRTVTVSAWMWIPGHVTPPQAHHRFLLAWDGSVFSETTAGDVVYVTDNWFRVTTTMTVRPNATHFDLRLYSPYTSGWYAYDAVQVELGDVATQWTNYVSPTFIDGDSIRSGNIYGSYIEGGTIVGATMSAGTMTGTTVRTAANGARAEMNANGLFYYGYSGETMFSATNGGVMVKGNLRPTALDFTGVGVSRNASPGQTIRWYRGDFAQLLGYTSMWTGDVWESNAWVNYGMREDVVYAQSGNQGSIAEHTMRVSRNDSGNGMMISLQHRDDYGSYFRVFQDGIAQPLFQVTHTGSVTILPAGTGDEAAFFWLGRASFMRTRENWGWRFDGGNNTTMTYGGQGCAHVVTLQSGASTAGNAYSQAYSYAAIHVDYSDGKLKHSIRDVPEAAALSKVRALRPRRWGFKGGHLTSHSEQGFVAEEVAEIIPDAIERIVNVADGTVTLGLKPTAIIAQLVSAVQELSEVVNVLRGEAPSARLDRNNVKPLVKG